jgi:hypothetical protein
MLRFKPSSEPGFETANCRSYPLILTFLSPLISEDLRRSAVL